MKKIQKLFFLLIITGLFSGCQHNDTDNTRLFLGLKFLEYQKEQRQEYIRTHTQYADAADSPIVIGKDSVRLVLNGAEGKKIYMTRINPNNATLKIENSRSAVISSSSQNALQKNSEDNAENSRSIDTVPGFDSFGTDDPHKKIYDYFIEQMKEKPIQTRNSTPETDGPQNFSIGDETTFKIIKPNSIAEDKIVFEETEFVLIDTGDDYNVWVKKDDSFYTEDSANFTTEAQLLGKKFIHGYNVVSHIYGSASDNLYIENDDKTISVYGSMSEISKTGEKTNIMLYELVTEGKVYGFVYYGDICYNYGNNGRFVYICSKTLVNTPMEAYSTALHEYSHNISKNVKEISNTVGTSYWYNELLAMTCEDMMQSYLEIEDSDVDGNMICTPKARLPQANMLGYVRGLSGSDSLAYASIFHFGAWLSRNFGGVKFIKELATNNYADMESILNAINTVNGTSYTTTTLLQKYAEDLVEEESGKGHNKNAPTYDGSSEFTCNYTDTEGNEKTYLYPLTAINLWEPFYGWCNYSNSKAESVFYPEKFLSNQSIAFSDLPQKNIYAKTVWEKTPTIAYLGPVLFNNGTLTASMGAYSTMNYYLGEADSDAETIEILNVSASTDDVITIWVK